MASRVAESPLMVIKALPISLWPNQAVNSVPALVIWNFSVDSRKKVVISLYREWISRNF